jgi:uncharacterized RDD family membrane protein YckC
MEIVSTNRYAGFFRRFIAFIIDALVLRMILIVLLGYWSDVDVDMFSFGNLFNRNTIIVEIIIMIYFVLCESSSWQATLGKKLLGIKVVTEGYGRPTVRTAAIRYVAKYLSDIFLLGFIWVIFDDKKQGWHDKIAATYVIRD